MDFDQQLLQIFLYVFVPTAVAVGFLSVTKEFHKLANISFFLVFILISLLLLFRKVDAGADFRTYAAMYNRIDSFGDVFTQYHGNVFFSFVLYLGQLLNLETFTFFTLYGILILVLYSLSCRLFLPMPYATLALVFFGTTSSFIFYSTNIVRQGLGCTLFIFALGLWYKNKKIESTLVQIFSFFSHFSIVFLIFSHLFSRFFKNKKILLFSLMPLMPLPGFILLKVFSAIGGIFQKIENFGEKDYSNKLVYIKIILLYCFGILIHKSLQHIKKDAFSNAINQLFSVYLLILSVCFLTLPVLLIASRLIYYPSALLPIFFSFLIMHLQKNDNKLVYTFIWIWISLFYAAFVFSFGSTARQLGL